MSNRITGLLYKILKAYDIPITCHTIEQTIPTHPGYPSMQCISETPWIAGK
jgi:peptidoglycan/xylan/chitin deacetylase (PgdA/CDA1 family)